MERWTPPTPDHGKWIYRAMFLPSIRMGRGQGFALNAIRAAIGKSGILDSENARLGFALAAERVASDERDRERYLAGEPWPTKISQPILRAPR